VIGCVIVIGIIVAVIIIIICQKKNRQMGVIHTVNPTFGMSARIFEIRYIFL